MGVHRRRPERGGRARAHRRTLFLAGCALVAVLAGLGLHGSATTDLAVPPALVGVWKGGSHSNGPWCYAFGADGGYRTWAVSSPGTVSTGSVFVAGTAITFSNGGVPVTATWTMSGGRLVLDGELYLRV